MKNIPVIGVIPRKYQSVVREKAISRARTRIIVAGGDTAKLSQDDLEVVVREEEEKIKDWFKEKGILALLALLGLSLLG